eukprot:2330798-Pyramimonas_sp.AAC.1
MTRCASSFVAATHTGLSLRLYARRNCDGGGQEGVRRGSGADFTVKCRCPLELRRSRHRASLVSGSVGQA